MTSFCLQEVKEVHEADYVSKRKLAQRTVLHLTCPSKHHISPGDNFYRVSQKKRPAFEKLLLPEYISNDIWQYLIK